jgi:primosomal protein N' (replication factor Y)
MDTFKNYPHTSLHLIHFKKPSQAFDATTIKAISKTLEKQQKVVIFVNKSGMHTGMICNSCGHIPYCHQCDLPISWHYNDHHKLFWLCSICQSLYTTMEMCPECKTGKMKGYGMGIQKVSDCCVELFNITPVLVQSRIANSVPKTVALIQSLDESRIILTTSLMQTALMQNVGLVVVQNALPATMPGFNSEYQNYIFLNNLIHSFQAPHILFQAHDCEHPLIQSIAQNDSSLFLNHDTEFKIKHHYPPYGELCILIYKAEGESVLFNKVNKLFHAMLALKTQQKRDDLELYAVPATIYKIYNKYRYQIVVKGVDVRTFMDEVFVSLKPYAKGFKIDRGAQSFY